MAALPNIGGALCECSVIPFLGPRCKLWLTPTARVPCSNAANIGKCKTWTHNVCCSSQNSIRGQQPQKCIYSIPAQETAKRHAKFGWPPLSDVGAVMKPRRETRWNLLRCPKLANGFQQLVGRRSPHCEDKWRRYCHLISFCPMVDTCLTCEDVARQSCAMVRRWRFLA